LKDRIRLFVVAWSIGLLGGLLLWLLRITTRVKVEGYNRRKLDPKDKGLILIHNHPSLWEPALLPFLFFPWYLFSLRFVPLSIPDKRNYHDKWWFSLFRAVCIPMERGNPKGEARALRRMQEKLLEGRVLILAPEGGRTFKGEEFKVIRGGKIDVVGSLPEIDLRKNKALRRFKPGVGWLVFNTKAEILPVWTEGGEEVIPNKFSFKLPFPRFWRQTRLKIGEPLDLGELPKKEITEFLEDSMLKVGAEGQF
jgi:1-acyl-sn-glycerol-3-phosphate acyltransferase